MPKISGATKTKLKVALFTLPTVLALAEYTFQLTTVHGSSMSPAINKSPGETTRVLVNKWPLFSINAIDNLHINDVVYIRSPLNPEKFLIKRIKGLQGDVIKTNFPKYPKAIVKIPVNHVWVEGDNQFHSIDSNTFGPISVGLIEAKVVKKLEFPFLTDVPHGGREARMSKIQSIGDES